MTHSMPGRRSSRDASYRDTGRIVARYIEQMGLSQTGTNNSDDTSVTSGSGQRGQSSCIYVKSVENSIPVEGKDMVIEPCSQLK